MIFIENNSKYISLIIFKMDDNLEKFIKYSMENGSNENVELEARFGSYNKLTSNIKPHTFFKIYDLFKSRSKSYSFIKDVLYEDVRKRNTLDDIKGYVKYMFDNPDEITEIINDYTKTYSKVFDVKNIQAVYLSKEKIFKPIISENIKVDLVLEKVDRPSTNKKATYVKNKFRCSLKGLWDIDMTILLITDCKTNMSGIYFEVEMEFNYKMLKKSTFEQILDEFKQNSNAIITTIECARNTPLRVELRYGIFNQVVTLERQYLPKIISGKYSVTEKADGERVFIYIDDKKNVYRLNPTNIILIKVPLATLQKNLKITNTLIDGELITIKGKLVFLGFDLLYFNSKDYRNFNLDERLNCLKTTVTDLNNSQKSLKIGMEFKVKTFYTTDVFANAAKIWNNRAKLFPYNLDGLIFTPVRGSYQSNLPNFKWKDKHSIDVRILYNHKFNFTEFHPHAMPYTRRGSTEITNTYTDQQTGNVYYTKRIAVNNLPKYQVYKQMNLVSARGDLGIHGKLEGAENLKNMVDIVEVEYDTKSGKWVFLRIRPDKEKPNAFKSIISVLDAISDNITISEISKIKHKQSEYELVCSDFSSKAAQNKCYTNSGFNFVSSDINSYLCQFYVFAYANIFKKINPSTNTILILGCDICVLQAASKIYKNILVLESNCLEVYGEQQSEGYTGLLEYARIFGINACIIWGNSDISNGLKAFTASGQNKMDLFMKKNMKKNMIFDSVFIKSFPDMFYNNRDGISKDMYVNNVKQLKLITNHIIGIYLNGSQIIKYLETQDCILTKNKELHPLYRLYLKNKNLAKYKCPDIFKIKNIKLVEIQRIQNSFESQYQPLLFDKNIHDIINDVGLKIKECRPFNTFYNEYKKNDGVMTDYDCIISNITKYFII